MNTATYRLLLFWPIITLLLIDSQHTYAQKKNLTSGLIQVWGNCQLCKHRIETTLTQLGVDQSDWNMETNRLKISYDSTKLSIETIQRHLASVGHDTEVFQADDQSYESLPGCCRYIRHTMSKAEPINKTSASPIINEKQLNEVLITSRRPSTHISSSSTFNMLHMSAKELTKAACCNLSESFETSPSVDVNYADAVTGVKQIQLLGLSGNYTQILTENVPEIRGLTGSYGLTFIPGPWIESIQIVKGTGSVVNGYESIAGQINIEEKKPDNGEKWFINGYTNEFGRLETSVNLSKKLDNRWSTTLLTHANGILNKMDENQDSFLDIPLGQQFNMINRWKYANNDGFSTQFAIKILTDNRQAGQKDFEPSSDKFKTNQYGIGTQIQQYVLSGKLGYVFPQKTYKSIGLIYSAMHYDNQAYYGLRTYNAKQKSIYANLIYQSIIASVEHQFRTGISLVSDHYDENFYHQSFQRKEIVPGSFFEYTYNPGTKFIAVAGLRIDYHNQYHWIATPRLNIKYNFRPETALRFSIGSGFRTAHIFAENSGAMVSSRQYEISHPSLNYAYGLNPEKAWNYGLNLAHNFNLNSRSGSLCIDAYRTIFTNQVVMDVETNPQKILFYDLNGRSFSNSIQAELNYEPLHRLDIRLAYRWLDVQTNYGSRLLQKALVAKHRAFLNLAYQTQNHWKFDYTIQWFGQKRLPTIASNSVSNLVEGYSPAYLQLMAQVSKQFGKALEVYTGSENLTNYLQQYAIIGADKPFESGFDGSRIWGPINGRMFYMGLRYKIK
ncbi:MAG: TonB-dependent receptor [Pedobacter sp.]|nr:MAG: TonB-dependent receptor [Pedobacter sp.]